MIDKSKSFEIRYQKFLKIREEYPGHIPIILRKSINDKNLPDIGQKNFIVPDNILVSYFIGTIKTKIETSAVKSIWLSSKGKLISPTEKIKNIHYKYADTDGFLYLEYRGEDTFGNIDWLSEDSKNIDDIIKLIQII